MVTKKQLTSPDYKPPQSLELKFRAYLALYHLNPHSGSTLTDEDEVLLETTRRVDEYRTYLNQHGQQFIEDSQYAQYFNIPYVMSIDTEKHEEFRKFFEVAWKKEVSQELKETLNDISQQAAEEEQAEQEAGSGDEGEGTVRPSTTRKQEPGTHLEQIMRFFIKEKSNTNSTLEANTEFEVIENKAEEIAAQIENSKATNRQKMHNLGKIAAKYEALKDEYENFKHQIEEQLKLDFIASPSFVLVESKNKKSAIEEREKLENEAVKSFQKELGRKLTPAENRTFRSQFKERLANYSIISFNKTDPSKENTDENKQVESQWKRLLWETARSMYASTKASKVVIKKPEPGKKEPVDKAAASEDAAQKEAKARVDLIEQKFAQAEPSFTSVPQELGQLLISLGLNRQESLDRQYKLDDEYFKSLLDPSDPVTTKPVYPYDEEDKLLTALGLLVEKYYQDPKFKLPKEKELFAKTNDYLKRNVLEFLTKYGENFEEEKVHIGLNITLPMNMLYAVIMRPASDEFKAILRDPKSVIDLFHKALDWILNLTNSVGFHLIRSRLLKDGQSHISLFVESLCCS